MPSITKNDNTNSRLVLAQEIEKEQKKSEEYSLETGISERCQTTINMPTNEEEDEDEKVFLPTNVGNANITAEAFTAAASSSLMLSNYLFGTSCANSMLIKDEESQQHRPSSLALFPFIQQHHHHTPCSIPPESLNLMDIMDNHSFHQNSVQLNQISRTPNGSCASSAFYSPSSTIYPTTSSIYSEPLPESIQTTFPVGFSPSGLDFGMLWSPHWPTAAATLAAANDITVGDNQQLHSPALEYHQVHFSGTPTNSALNCQLFGSGTASGRFSSIHQPQVFHNNHLSRGAANLSPRFSNAAAVAAAELMTRNNSVAIYQGMRQQNNAHGTGNTRKGGRRPREVEEDSQNILTDEDRDKRAKRRQRNKEAAARCRKRRLDLMTTLQEQVDQLKDENRQKQMIIEQLIQQNQHNNCIIQQKESLIGTFQSNNQSKDFQQQHLMNQMMQQKNTASMQQQQNSPEQQRCNSRNNNNRVVNNDIILFKEEEDLMQISASPSSHYSNSIKRPKMEDDGLPGLNDSYERPTSLSLGGHSFDGINLNSITTPSHGNEYGLLHQRTFLTPIVTGPMLIPNTSAPLNGSMDLRQL